MKALTPLGQKLSDLSGWSDERVSTLLKLWDDGLSASQCAKQLGGVTRNAVLGKLSRLGVLTRVTPSRPTRVSPPKPKPPSPSKLRIAGNGAVFQEPTPRAPLAEVPVFDEAAPPAGVIALADLEPHHCRFPLGDPRHPKFGFCGRRRKQDGKVLQPYCDDHCAKAYVGKPAKPTAHTFDYRAARARRAG